LAVILNPLNTSMIAMALPEVRHAFAVSARASTGLLTAFAAASAVGHPLAGRLADRFGARRIFTAGLVVAGLSSLFAAYTSSFSLLIALRVGQALGTSAAFPAGLALLRGISARRGNGNQSALPAAWLGVIAMSANVTAAMGPLVAGIFVASLGWRWIFLINVPLTIAGAVAAVWFLPADREHPQKSAIGLHGLAKNRALLSVNLRFAAICLIFFSAFFALPSWLQHERRLTAANAALVMLPLVGCSALAMPIAARTIARTGASTVRWVGAAGLFVGSGALALIGANTPTFVLVIVLGCLGVPYAFNNLGLQTELTDISTPEQLGTAAGFFQTARFAGAALAGTMVGVAFTDGATTSGLRRLCLATAFVSLVLFILTTKRGART
jgi:MFS family permease